MARNAISKRILAQYAAGERIFRLEREDGNYDFSHATLAQANFIGSSIFADFTNADLEGANFSNCNVKTCDFSGANLRSASFCNSAIDSAIFEAADLDGANFEGAGAYGYDFRRGELPIDGKFGPVG